MYKIVLSYDGTRYFGWQKTAMGPSIQEELQKAILRITGESVLPEAASRTDRGVHAEGQVVQFTLQKEADLPRFQRSLNALLPSDIRVLQLSPLHFHPTLDAIEKEYHYRLSLGPVQDPTERLYAWHIRETLDFNAMNRAAHDLLGTHDFTTFAGEPEKNPICTLQALDIHPFFSIRGNRFLYKMVRTLVGTLIAIGRGKLPSDSIPSLLRARDRKSAGPTAPAHGLHLHQVFYPLN